MRAVLTGFLLAHDPKQYGTLNFLNERSVEVLELECNSVLRLKQNSSSSLVRHCRSGREDPER